jgi:DNA polymerase-1
LAASLPGEAAPGAVLPGDAGPAARLVFFQHDEVIVHCPEPVAAAVGQHIEEAAAQARRLLFGDTPVRLPVDVHIVESYADAK